MSHPSKLCLIGGCRFAKLADNLDLVTGIWVKLLGKLEIFKQYLIYVLRNEPR